MRAKFIATALSLSVITLSAHAVIPKDSSVKKKPPIVIHKIDLNTADLSTLNWFCKGYRQKTRLKQLLPIGKVIMDLNHWKNLPM